MSDLVKAEFHCHSIYSSDSLATLESLIQEARRKGIQRLAITDHSNLEGALIAKKIDSELIVVGEEVKTNRGEILAYYLTNKLPKGINPEEAFKRLKDQGAFISLSHPFDTQREHWTEEEVEHFLPYLDAIEVFNSRCMNRKPNQHAADVARRLGIPGMVGSDAHIPWEMGRSSLTLPAFQDAQSLREALKNATAETRLSTPLIHFSSRYAYMKKAWQRSREEK